MPEQVTYGEILSTTLLCAKLQAEGIPALWLDSRKLVVKEDEAETFRRIRQAVGSAEAPIYVAPGFICQDKDGNISTLGRGGSDYSAALFAAAIGAGSLQIWTDVPGIMTANPKQVPAARTIPRMSYAAALDMASHGAKVLYAPTVAPAMAAGIDIEIRNTFAPEGKYTVIGAEADAARWIGVASEGGHIRLAGSRTAAPGTGCEAASKALTEAGIAALSIRAEGASLDVQVRESVLEQALRALHRAFFQELPIEEINLFIAGDGAVAGALLGMLRQTADTVKERTGKLLRVVGRANSRQWGIDLGGQPQLSQSGDYIAAILQSAPKGALFVDVTNSETLYKRYVELLEAGIGIVSSNRRSIAVPYPEYAAMQAAARENGVPFRYETTVGAALPMLESIARGANSCNEILSIEAVVSCTLNQILGDYRPGGESFASLVRKAQAAGLTEPDPRLDLSGRDALRKLLILAREAGVQLEEEDVEITPVVPLAGGSVEDFYQALEAQEEVPFPGSPRGRTPGVPPPFRGLAGKDGRRLPGRHRHPQRAAGASRLPPQGHGERHHRPQRLPPLSPGHPGPRRRRPRSRLQHPQRPFALAIYEKNPSFHAGHPDRFRSACPNRSHPGRQGRAGRPLRPAGRTELRRAAQGFLAPDLVPFHRRQCVPRGP